MRAWRICAAKYARTAYAGEGARIAGGRWNLPGVSLVYTSSSLSLAALEMFIHFDPGDIPTRLVYISAFIPDTSKVEELPMARLPRDWRKSPAPESIQKLGTDWVQSGRSLVLSVPSAVIPIEPNYLINPNHPEFRNVTMAKPRPFTFDSRMWK